jgi:perosamine synthetase
MRKEFLPFHKASIGEEEIREVTETLRSGWITSGPKTKEFEKKFAAAAGAKYGCAVNSCTAAMHLALAAIGIKAGDEVIVPVMTFTATAEVVTYFGAVPVFADCDPETMLIDIGHMESRITARTKALIPVHYGGQSCDIDTILKIARRHNLKVIWDAAHAFPTFYRGKNIGSFPDIVCFSFYATKTLTTGEGGMAVTDNEDYIERIRLLSLHGMSRDAWKRYSRQGSWSYDVVAPGFKYNMTDIAAAMGLVQLKRAGELLEKRRQIAERYDKAFSGSKQIKVLKKMSYGAGAWHLYVIRIDCDGLGIVKNDFIEEMKKRNIGVGVHFIPLNLHFYWRKTYSPGDDNFPNAMKAHREIISLPIFPDMSDKDVDDVADAVKEIVRFYGK